MTGKFDGERGYRLRAAIEALALARRGGLDARLAIAGHADDAVAADIARWSEEAGVADAVERRGAYTQAEAPAIYGAADAYLALSYMDPCPHAVIEALSCGLPVLHADSGGIPELVGAEAGIGLAVPEDWERIHAPAPLAIAEGMARLASGRAEMAVAARRRAVERFDIEAWLARHDAVFRALIGRDA